MNFPQSRGAVDLGSGHLRPVADGLPSDITKGGSATGSSSIPWNRNLRKRASTPAPAHAPAHKESLAAATLSSAGHHKSRVPSAWLKAAILSRSPSPDGRLLGNIGAFPPWRDAHQENSQTDRIESLDRTTAGEPRGTRGPPRVRYLVRVCSVGWPCAASSLSRTRTAVPASEHRSFRRATRYSAPRDRMTPPMCVRQRRLPHPATQIACEILTKRGYNGRREVRHQGTEAAKPFPGTRPLLHPGITFIRQRRVAIEVLRECHAE